MHTNNFKNKHVKFIQTNAPHNSKSYDSSLHRIYSVQKQQSLDKEPAMSSKFKRLTSRSLHCVHYRGLDYGFYKSNQNSIYSSPNKKGFDDEEKEDYENEIEIGKLKNNGFVPKRPQNYFSSLSTNPFNNDNYSAALRPLREKYKLNPLERMFLEATERGDKSTVIRCLSVLNGLNVNCVNMLGRTAIQIAVDNENTELVEVLLEQPGIKIGDALLYAIQEGVYKIVEMLINHPSITKEMLGSSWNLGKYHDFEESHDFSSDISPVILAAICNQFEILQLLINRGAQIDEPHKSMCNCMQCETLHKEDPLKHTLKRIITYRALASPAWISLTSPDPILTAFQLSSELLNLASRENEFKEIFISLSEQCRKYACDLLDLCRGTAEVVAVLSKGSDSDDSELDCSSDDSFEINQQKIYKLSQNTQEKTELMQNLKNNKNDVDNKTCSLSLVSSLSHQHQNHHHHHYNYRNYDVQSASSYHHPIKFSHIDHSNDSIDNDWREIFDRSHGNKRKHNLWYLNWTKNKPNQCVSIESQHTILEDSGDDNINLAASNPHQKIQSNQSSCHSQSTQFDFGLHSNTPNEDHLSYDHTVSEQNRKPNLDYFNSKAIPVKDSDFINIPFITTFESQNLGFYKHKQNSPKIEKKNLNFCDPIYNQKQVKNKEMSSSTSDIFCCYTLKSKTQKEPDNNFSGENYENLPESLLSDCPVPQNVFVNTLNIDKTTSKFKSSKSNGRTCYSFKLDRLKLAIKHEQKRVN